MIYPNKPFYVISGFEPHGDCGRYQFGIGLDTEFAKRFMEVEMPEEFYKDINRIGKEIIVDTNLARKEHVLRSPFMFVDNKKGNLTFLLRSIRVPGNSCVLGIDGMHYNSLQERNFNNPLVKYTPHNIDGSLQAYNLLSLWLKWSEHAFAIVNS